MNNPMMLQKLARIKQAEFLKEAEARRLAKSAEAYPSRPTKRTRTLAATAAAVAVVLGWLIVFVR
ncbi:MAG: hypothetical protein AAB217_09190 [Chloroflexota bacterium]